MPLAAVQNELDKTRHKTSSRHIFHGFNFICTVLCRSAGAWAQLQCNGRPVAACRPQVC